MGYVSEISKSVLVANLPEASDVEVKFTYNFYTRDENIINGATSTSQTSTVYTQGTATSATGPSVINQNGVDATYIVIPPTETGSAFIDYELEKRLAESQFKLPRNMTLTWQKPNLDEIAETLGVDVLSNVPVNISDHIDRIIYVEALGNQMYSGLVLQDVQADENFYREMQATFPVIAASVFGLSLTHELSSIPSSVDEAGIQTANRLIDNLVGFGSADDLTHLIDEFLPDSCDGTQKAWSADTKSQLAALMKNYEAQGIVHVSQDSIDKHADVLDEVKNIVQNITLKNTHAGDLILQAAMGVEGPYADDLVHAGADSSSTLQYFRSIQSSAIGQTGDTGLTSAMFGLQMRSENLVQWYDADYTAPQYTFTQADRSGASSAYTRQGTPGGGNAAIGLAGFLIDKKMSYNTDSQGGIDVNINTDAMIVEILNTSDTADSTTFGSSNSVVATEIRDGNVPYGARVIYRVRSVYYVEMDAVNVQADEDEIARVGVLLASRGSHFVQANAIEMTPPPVPQNLTFLYDYTNGNLIVNWDFPVNPQRDITKFRVFKREHTVDFGSGDVMNNTKGDVSPPDYDSGGSGGQSVSMPIEGNAYDKPFELVHEYDFNSTFNPGDYTQFLNTPAAFETSKYAPHLYTHTPSAPITRHVDTRFNKDTVVIYAVTSVDARGFSSNLSQQFEVSFDIRKNSIAVRYIAGSGAPLCYPNLNLTVQYDQSQFNDNISGSPYTNLAKISGLENVSIVFNPMCYKVNNIDPKSSDTIGDTGSGTGHIPSYSTAVERDVIKFGGTIDGSDDSALSATPVYKLKILNIDVQKEKTIDIYVNDKRTGALPPASAESHRPGASIAEGRPSMIPYLII